MTWRGSTLSTQLSLSREKAIASVDPGDGGGGGGTMINMERINTQLSLLYEKAITSVDPGRGQINSECREDQQSMYSVERVNSQCRQGQQATFTFV